MNFVSKNNKISGVKVIKVKFQKTTKFDCLVFATFCSETKAVRNHNASYRRSS